MRLKSFILPALLAGSALAFTTVSASAYVACNAEGDCWHTESRWHPPGVNFTFHPDDWYFHQTWDSTHHFREYNKGRGYWKGGVWVRL